MLIPLAETHHAEIMILRWCWAFLLANLLYSCFLRTDPFLDPSIPRLVTPTDQIATVRTKWINGKLQQTTFLDKQNRIVEDFIYGRTNQKILNQYEENYCASRIVYYHSDSSERGYIDIIKSRFEYDQEGRMIHEHIENSSMGNSGIEKKGGSYVVNYKYDQANDTLVSRQPPLEPNTSAIADVNRWERNSKGQLIHNFRLYVMKMPHDSRPDTINYYSHRFSYDKLGRRNMAWYDLMYLGRFYISEGPDTIKYEYDQYNRILREKHLYTLDRRNKREIDTTKLEKFDRESAKSHRQQFFIGDRIFHNNEKTNIVEYHYETFNPDKHLPLQTSQDIDY